MPTDTKTALLDSAERAARTRGFDGFSYADLAQDVGIRKASIHHHFPTKAALSVALMERYYNDLKAVCEDIDVSQGTGGARLTALIDRYRTALDGGKSLCLCVSFSTSRESLPAEVIAQIGRFREMIIAWTETVFAAGQIDGSIARVTDPAVEAAAALPLLEGAQLAARVEENPALFDSAVRILTQRL
ncbi:TetR/AcrR family transcriptional regulator [Loktanella sp. F6476L]|uniref:TetR/AcrR family transcriptional regulator n=1 Tax=Loktanella sp. F6476L TaxID=2926405 RepID=UPI001FF0F71E|nr:TetR/AcrR family transcriptional regulator [Loktanella sp. F6476L]MCK0122163.1 TetR/AcrR family transcriptional regulator [Loktanella sp. F6476L]